MASSALSSSRGSGGKTTPEFTPFERVARLPLLLSGLGYLVAGCWAVSGEDGGYWASGRKSCNCDGLAGALGQPGAGEDLAGQSWEPLGQSYRK